MRTMTDPFRCPSCDSSNTQLLKQAYQQALRHGQTFDSISELGERIAPPQPKDERFFPSIAALATCIACLFVLDDLIASLFPATPENLTALDWELLLPSVVIGWTIGLAIAIPRVRFNVHVLPEMLEQWEKTAICKRCGTQFDVHPLGTKS